MKIELPSLTFSNDPEAIKRNRELLRLWREAYKSALKALDGFSQANAGMCAHPNAHACYDPGYAGGGFSHHECPDCGYSGYLGHVKT